MVLPDLNFTPPEEEEEEIIKPEVDQNAGIITVHISVDPVLFNT
jgi:hypothetical protein